MNYMYNVVLVMQIFTNLIIKNQQNANIVSNSAVMNPAKLVKSLNSELVMHQIDNYLIGPLSLHIKYCSCELT